MMVNAINNINQNGTYNFVMDKTLYNSDKEFKTYLYDDLIIKLEDVFSGITL
jgi:hypothetical protein